MSRERNRAKYASRRFRTLVEALERRQMLDGSLPIISVSALAPVAYVSDGTPGVFAITRTGPTTGPLDVNFTLGGMARYGVNYDSFAASEDPGHINPPGGITIPAGQSTAVFYVSPDSPPYYISSETVDLTLGAGSGYQVGSPGSAEITIDGYTGPPTVTASASMWAMSEASGTPGTFTFTRTGSTAEGLGVEFFIFGDARLGVDYEMPGAEDIGYGQTVGFVSFEPGQSSVTVPFLPLDAGKVGGGSLEVDLESIGPDTGYYFEGDFTTIVDDDPAPVVTVAATTAATSESSTSPTVFTISRTGSTTQPLTLDYLLGGTAQYGVDYVGPDGSTALGANANGDSPGGEVTIPAGQSSVTVSIVPIDTGKVGGSVSVSLSIIPDPSGQFQVGSANSDSASIADDDTGSGSSGFGARDWVLTASSDPTSPHANIVLDEYSELAGYSQGAHGTVTTSLAFGYDGNSNPHYFTALEYVPGPGFYQGFDEFTYEVTSPGRGTTTGTVYIYVYDDRPVSLDNPGYQTSTEGDTPDLAFSATDPDDNPLTYSATGLPPGLSIDPLYGEITGTIDFGAGYNGPYDVTVTATDGFNGTTDEMTSTWWDIAEPLFSTGSVSFEWDVNPAAPSIDNEDDAQWDDMNDAEGDAVSVPVEASDPNGLTLIYDATGLPPGLMIDPRSGLISGTVAAGDDAGTPYDVTVTVTNGFQSSTLEFPWTIDRISLDSPSDRVSIAGDTVSLPVAANDENGYALTYFADGLPDGLSIDPATGLISGTIDASAADGMPYEVTITATDGVETSDRTFNWSVNPVTMPTIVVANPGDQENATDDAISLQVQASTSDDEDTTELQFSATGLPPEIDIDPDTGLIEGFDEYWSDDTSGSTYTVTIVVTDGYGQTASQTFLWSFTPTSSGSPTSPPTSPPTGDGLIPIGEDGGPSTNDVPMPPPAVLPSRHPATEDRSDGAKFSNELFWQDVEVLPGGIAAENWLASKNGQVEWAWAGTSTYGRYDYNANNDYVPFVYIPQRYDEAYAAQCFVHNIAQDYSIYGWAGDSKLPDPGDINKIDDWLNYFKQIHSEQFKAVSGAAQAALTAATIVNEGADWVVNINDLQNAKTTGEVAIAMIAFLPFITGSMLKIRQVVNGVATDVLEISAKDIQEIRTLQKSAGSSGNVSDRLKAIFDDYWKLSGGTSVDDAKAIAKAHGFDLEIGRQSRFENARNSVVISKADLRGGEVNRIELAEEIQHGLDWATNQASKSKRRNQSLELFHADVFQRILDGYNAGDFQFLTPEDRAALGLLVAQLRQRYKS